MARRAASVLGIVPPTRLKGALGEVPVGRLIACAGACSGGSGNDWLDFGAGNESFTYCTSDSFGNETLLGGAGSDTLYMGVGWNSGPINNDNYMPVAQASTFQRVSPSWFPLLLQSLPSRTGSPALPIRQPTENKIFLRTLMMPGQNGPAFSLYKPPGSAESFRVGRFFQQGFRFLTCPF